MFAIVLILQNIFHIMMSKKVPFTYYNVVTDFAPRLENLKLLKKEKQFLKKCGENSSLPNRLQYRSHLRKITRLKE